jgi:osmotically-inducible protein OsmY
MLPYYGLFDRFAYQVDGEKVTLFGEVTRPVLKRDAEEVVKAIEGVRSVDNQIEVLPLLSHDERIGLDLYKALYGDVALSRYGLMAVPSIHIIVRNGNVTLDDVVDREADKSIAAVRANQVAGVFSVTNNLQVIDKERKK